MSPKDLLISPLIHLNVSYISVVLLNISELINELSLFALRCLQEIDAFLPKIFGWIMVQIKETNKIK